MVVSYLPPGRFAPWLAWTYLVLSYHVFIVLAVDTLCMSVFCHSHFCSKEYRFSVKSSSPSKDVASQIRQTIGLREEKPFNAKWLDIEGNSGRLDLYLHDLTPPPSPKPIKVPPTLFLAR